MKNEIERRWMPLSLDPKVYAGVTGTRFLQGYFNMAQHETMRVRIMDGTHAKLTHKRGKGMSRPETEVSIPIESALELYEHCCTARLEKTRYVVGRCEIDVFHGPLEGLKLVEIEYEEGEKFEEIPLPDWLVGAIEVTDSVNNLMLAKLATILGNDAPQKPLREYLPYPIPLIVLTGGPGSGKTTAMEQLKVEFGHVVKFVPEAATILISQVGIVPPVDDAVGFAKFQQTILRVQHAFEEASIEQAQRDGKKAVILDRGTLDNAAYLPNGVQDLERICGVRATDELARYAQVIWLATPEESVYEKIRSNNPARRESFKEAFELGRRIHMSWTRHHALKTAKLDNWMHKYEQVRDFVLGAIPD